MREAARLRRTRDVQRLRHEGASRGDRLYVVMEGRGRGETSRLAIRVPVHVGSAVVRNRARRRARAAFAPLLARLARTTDLLVTVRPAASEASFADLSRSAESLLREHSLLGRP